jgi:FKBP-type peptidyl-prolyl cis-trans isomerase FklB
MKFTLLVVLFALTIPVVNAGATEALKLDNDTTRINYSLGYQIGNDFKRQGVQIDAAAVIKGIEDALSGAEPLVKPEEMRAALDELKRKVVAEEKARREKAQLQAIEEGTQYRENYGKQDGVVTTPSGLQYKILEPGVGKTPGPTDKVTVNYRGTGIDGKEFDSSYKRGRPASFPLNGVIKGWTEGLQHVKEGGKIQLVIPPELAYGTRGPLANQTLVFDVELISVGEPQAGASAPSSASDQP